jgi:hypothetical protein
MRELKAEKEGVDGKLYDILGIYDALSVCGYSNGTIKEMFRMIKYNNDMEAFVMKMMDFGYECEEDILADIRRPFVSLAIIVAYSNKQFVNCQPM